MTDEKKTTPAGLAEATVKFEHASSGLELFREEQKAWSELSFIREENGEITNYWALPEIRGVSENDAYTAQCYLGSLYAFEVFDLIETFKSRVEGIGFSPVAQSIVERGQWTGFEIGFFSSVDEYITDGQIKVAGGVLARPEEEDQGLVQDPVEITDADAVLEKLAADYHAASEAGDHAQDALDAARQPDAPVSLAESGEMAILDRMLGIDAEGLRGVRAKVQAMFAPWAWERFKGPDTSMFDPLIDQDMLRSVVVDLERLGGRNG